MARVQCSPVGCKVTENKLDSGNIAKRVAIVDLLIVPTWSHLSTTKPLKCKFNQFQ